jgi:ankyrin repeat protein
MGTQEAFFSAIESGHADQVRELLTTNAQLVNAKTAAGLSAVLLATYHGRNEIAKLLIDRGARLDIFEAAATGTQERVEQLLHKDPTCLNSYSADGWTPLHLAVFFGRINIVQLLLNKGADINAPSKNDQRVMPLHSALANPHNAAVAQLLIERGADLHTGQAEGYTPLHYAAANGLERIVKTLIARSADPSAKEIGGKTAYDLAVQKGYTSIAELLKPN